MVFARGLGVLGCFWAFRALGFVPKHPERVGARALEEWGQLRSLGLRVSGLGFRVEGSGPLCLKNPQPPPTPPWPGLGRPRHGLQPDTG